VGKPDYWGASLLNLKRFIPRGAPLVIILGAIVLAVVLVFSRPDTPQRPRPERAWAVDLQQADRQTLRPTLSLYGRIESPQDAQLSAGIEAEVVEVRVQEGSTAAADEVLLVLDGRDAELELMQRDADVADSQAQLRLTERRLARNKEVLTSEQELLVLTEKNAQRAASLFKDGVLSQSDVDTTSEAQKRQQLGVTQRKLTLEESEIELVQLRARLQRSKALRDQAKLKLARTQIRAPFNGVVADLTVSQGDRVRVGDALLSIYNPDALEVRTQIPTRYVQSVREALTAKQAMPATIQADDTRLGARLLRIAGQTRQGTGGVDSFLGFTDIPDGVRLGMTVSVQLDLPPEPDVIAVPAEAMSGPDQIYKVVDSRMQMVPVERVGEQQLPDGATRVLVRSSELADNDQIIVTKLSNSMDGLLVRAATAQDAEPPGRVARKDGTSAGER
jgi:RND family efflux transporter MFP subunit